MECLEKTTLKCKTMIISFSLSQFFKCYLHLILLRVSCLIAFLKSNKYCEKSTLSSAYVKFNENSFSDYVDMSEKLCCINDSKLSIALYIFDSRVCLSSVSTHQ